MKWINEGGIFFPISDGVIIHETPGPGVFQVCKSNNPNDNRLGLYRVCDKFEFNHKIYSLGCEKMIKRIKDVWNSDEFVEKKKNLGVIFNGQKGTGKTISAKVLCNEVEMPVIIIDNALNGGILQFIQSINFEAIVLLDEAEKTFQDEDSGVLLKLIDGVYNNTRKLYILTTNRLTVNENLINRPGRIRYIQEFGNLVPQAISEYLDDNLKNLEYKKQILELVDLLEFSTIDILRNIVEEVNILGIDSIGEESPLNIPRSKYIFDAIYLGGLTNNATNKDLVCKVIDQYYTDKSKSLYDWFWDNETEITNEDGSKSMIDNSELLGVLIDNCTYSDIRRINSDLSRLYEGTETNCGKVVSEVDERGFLTMKDSYGNECLYLLLRRRDNPSLYSGKLKSLIY